MAAIRLGADPTVQDLAKAYGFKAEDVAPGVAAASAATAPRQHEAVDRDEVAPAMPVKRPYIPLSRVYTVRGVSFDRLYYRPPRGVDFWTHGAPFGHHPDQNGNLTYVEYQPVLRLYADWCVVPAEGLRSAEMIDALDMPDTLALRRAVRDFFMARPAGSATSSTPPSV